MKQIDRPIEFLPVRFILIAFNRSHRSTKTTFRRPRRECPPPGSTVRKRATTYTHGISQKTNTFVSTNCSGANSRKSTWVGPLSSVNPARALDVASTPSSSIGMFCCYTVSSAWPIDLTAFGRVWTALHRGVHSTDFMFMALKNGRQGNETEHDVYCSECGTLTAARCPDDSEGPQANIQLAGVSCDVQSDLRVDLNSTCGLASKAF
jgi:hypothetical protein